MRKETEISGHPSRGGRPWAGRIWHGLVEGFAAVGTAMICVLMVIICADIVARNSLGASLPLVSEAGALLLVMIVAVQLAATIRADRLAKTQIFIRPFTRRFPRGGAIVAATFHLTGAVLLALIAWGSVRILQKDYGSAEFIGIVGMATLPTWPFRLLILMGFAIAALELCVQAVAALRGALGPRP